MLILADQHQDHSPVGDSLGLSSLLAIVPLLVLFVLLGVVPMRV
jgi:lactate permease